MTGRTTACRTSSPLLSAPDLAGFLPFAELALFFPLCDMVKSPAQRGEAATSAWNWGIYGGRDGFATSMVTQLARAVVEISHRGEAFGVASKGGVTGLALRHIQAPCFLASQGAHLEVSHECRLYRIKY